MNKKGIAMLDYKTVIQVHADGRKIGEITYTAFDFKVTAKYFSYDTPQPKADVYADMAQHRPGSKLMERQLGIRVPSEMLHIPHGRRQA